MLEVLHITITQFRKNLAGGIAFVLLWFAPLILAVRATLAYTRHEFVSACVLGLLSLTMSVIVFCLLIDSAAEAMTKRR